MVSSAGSLVAERVGDNFAAVHGLARALANNAVVGVTEGFKKDMDVVGVGYKADVQGKKIVFALGYSHPVEYVLPDLANPARHAGLAKKVQRLHARGLAVAGAPPHLGGELFEAAWRLRGFENFMMDLAHRGEIADYLLDQLTSMLIENALILARAGVDILLLDDDVAMPTGLMISPSTRGRSWLSRSSCEEYCTGSGGLSSGEVS